MDRNHKLVDQLQIYFKGHKCTYMVYLIPPNPNNAKLDLRDSLAMARCLLGCGGGCQSPSATKPTLGSASASRGCLPCLPATSVRWAPATLGMWCGRNGLRAGRRQRRGQHAPTGGLREGKQWRPLPDV